MPIDPRTLEGIRNPLAGLSNIGSMYAKGVEVKQNRELLDMKKDALVVEAEQRAAKKISDDAKEARSVAAEKRAIAKEERAVKSEARTAEEFGLEMKANLLAYDDDKKKDNYSDSQTVSAWIDRFKADAQANPEIAQNPQAYNQYLQQNLQGITDTDVLNTLRTTNPENFPQVRKNAQFAIDTYAGAEGEETFSEFAKIPGTELYGQQSSKNGKFSNVRAGIDGKSKIGGSEFERHLETSLERKLITQEKADELREKRVAVLAGTEMRAGPEARLTERQKDRFNKETVALRKEHTEGAKHFKGMNESIDGALAAVASGDTGLSDRLLNQVMSQVQDTKVRAFQMYGEFDREFGNLAQRVQGQVSRFLMGTRTDREKQEIVNTLTKFNESYVKPAGKKLRDRYRELALADGKDPFSVVPPTNAQDVRDSKLLSKKEKIEMIQRFNLDISK